MIKDKFGRDWKFASPHNHDQMLMIQPWVMRVSMDFQGQLALGPGAQPINWCREMDCYLLRYVDKGKVRWYSGIRFSDEPSDYMSSVLTDPVIDMLVDNHDRGYCSRAESDAYWALVGHPKLVASVINAKETANV
jgi:hypothetical protein